MLSHKMEISKEINYKGMGNEENFGILNHRPQNSLFPVTSFVRMFLLPENGVTTVLSILAICASATH